MNVNDHDDAPLQSIIDHNCKGGLNALHLKLNTMQFETPGGNHCCLMANYVQN